MISATKTKEAVMITNKISKDQIVIVLFRMSISLYSCLINLTTVCDKKHPQLHYCS